jgi:hypothetical protein
MTQKRRIIEEKKRLLEKIQLLKRAEQHLAYYNNEADSLPRNYWRFITTQRIRMVGLRPIFWVVTN